MSGLLVRLPFPVVPWLADSQIRAALERAEAAIDRPFNRRRSLHLDQLVLHYEQTRRRKVHRRRAA
jgi:hypothetical protein